MWASKFRAARQVAGSAFVLRSIASKGLGALCGFLVVRNLQPEDYGCFVLASMLASLVNQLTDAGLLPAFTAAGSRIFRRTGERSAVAVMVAVLRLRLRRALPAFALVVAIQMLSDQGNSNAAMGSALPLGWALMLGVAMIFSSTIYSGQASIGRADAVATVDLRTNMARGIVLATLSLFGCLSMHAAVASMLAMHLVGAAALWLLRAPHSQDAHDLNDSSVRLPADQLIHVRSDARKLLPNYIYYSVAGALPAFVLNASTAVGGLAEYGAFGRLGLLFAALAPVLNLKLIPHAAGQNEQSILRVAGAGLIVVIVGALLSAVLTSWIDLGAIVLGPEYGGRSGTLVAAVVYFWLRFGADTQFALMVGTRGQGGHRFVVSTAALVIGGLLVFNVGGLSANVMYLALAGGCLVEMVGCFLLIRRRVRTGV